MKPENPPAFPRVGSWPALAGVDREDLFAALATRTEPQEGMLMLDYFAGQTIAGMAALVKPGEEKHAALRAYALAQAMLQERERLLSAAEEEASDGQ